jgi:hypothetical protein
MNGFDTYKPKILSESFPTVLDIAKGTRFIFLDYQYVLLSHKSNKAGHAWIVRIEPYLSNSSSIIKAAREYLDYHLAVIPIARDKKII